MPIKLSEGLEWDDWQENSKYQLLTVCSLLGIAVGRTMVLSFLSIPESISPLLSYRKVWILFSYKNYSKEHFQPPNLFVLLQKVFPRRPFIFHLHLRIYFQSPHPHLPFFLKNSPIPLLISKTKWWMPPLPRYSCLYWQQLWAFSEWVWVYFPIFLAEQPIVRLDTDRNSLTPQFKPY